MGPHIGSAESVTDRPSRQSARSESQPSGTAHRRSRSRRNSLPAGLAPLGTSIPVVRLRFAIELLPVPKGARPGPASLQTTSTGPTAGWGYEPSKCRIDTPEFVGVPEIWKFRMHAHARARGDKERIRFRYWLPPLRSMPLGPIVHDAILSMSEFSFRLIQSRRVRQHPLGLTLRIRPISLRLLLPIHLCKRDLLTPIATSKAIRSPTDFPSPPHRLPLNHMVSPLLMARSTKPCVICSKVTRFALQRGEVSRQDMQTHLMDGGRRYGQRMRVFPATSGQCRAV